MLNVPVPVHLPIVSVLAGKPRFWAGVQLSPEGDGLNVQIHTGATSKQPVKLSVY